MTPPEPLDLPNTPTSAKKLKRWFSVETALVASALFFIVYIGYYYYFGNQYDRIALAQPQQLESVKMVRYYSPAWYGLQDNRDIAQLQTGERLFISPKPMGVLTGFLVPSLPIPNAYQTLYRYIERAEQPDGTLAPLGPGYPPPLVLQINRYTGHVCYKSDCAKLTSICPLSRFLGNPKGPFCQYFKH